MAQNTLKSYCRTTPTYIRIKHFKSKLSMPRKFSIVVLALVIIAPFFLLMRITEWNLKLHKPMEITTTDLSKADVSMDSEALLEQIRNSLIPPSTKSYNLQNQKLLQSGQNPSCGQVQVLQALFRSFGNNGFFLECGAYDGEWGSNSLWLERTLGWKGLLIEADGRTFEKLQQKQRNAWMGHFCLSKFTYPSMLTFYRDHSGVGSGLIRSDAYGAKFGSQVQCFPLYSILLAINRTTIDFFSLDVEGSEIDILKTVPFDKVIFKVITIEHNVIPEGKQGLRKFMESKGYVFLRTVVTPDYSSGDSIFAHQSVNISSDIRKAIGTEDKELLRAIRTKTD